MEYKKRSKAIQLIVCVAFLFYFHLGNLCSLYNAPATERPHVNSMSDTNRINKRRIGELFLLFYFSIVWKGVRRAIRIEENRESERVFC